MLSRVIQSECGKYVGILRGIMSVPHNKRVKLNVLCKLRNPNVYHKFVCSTKRRTLGIERLWL